MIDVMVESNGARLTIVLPVRPVRGDHLDICGDRWYITEVELEHRCESMRCTIAWAGGLQNNRPDNAELQELGWSVA